VQEQVPEAPPSSDLPNVRPNRTPVIVALVLILLLAAGGIGGFVWYSNKATAEKQAKAYRSLERCLLGDDLKPGEKPSSRFRRIQLTALAVDPLKTAEAIWPQTCATYAHAVHETLAEAGRASKDGKDTAGFAESLGKLLKDPQPKEDILVVIDRVWQEAAKEKFLPIAVTDVKPPPKAAEPLTVDNLKGVLPVTPTPLKLDGIKMERIVGGDIHFYLDHKAHLSPPLLCTFGADLSCRPLDDKIRDRDLVLGGAADPGEAPLLFSAPRGEGGIYQPDGTEVESLFSYGGYVAKGSRILFGFDTKGKKFKLVTYVDAKRREDLFPLKNVTDDRDVALVFDRIVYAAEGSLFAQRVVPGEPPTAAPVSLGQVAPLTLLPGLAGSLPSSIRGCKTNEALVVVARTYEGEVVVMDTGDKWWPIRGASTHNEWTGNFLTCRGREAFIVRRSIEYRGGGISGKIAFQRCSVDQCTQQVVDVREFFRDVKELEPDNSYLYQTAELDGKLLVVWKGGKRGGIRMRLGPAESIAKVDDTVIFDDMIHDGEIDRVASSVTEMRLFSRSNTALLLLQTALGTHGLKIEPNGTVTPMQVRLEK
jgi:hypothetical protein